jgi:hypothetical protein
MASQKLGQAKTCDCQNQCISKKMGKKEESREQALPVPGRSSAPGVGHEPSVLLWFHVIGMMQLLFRVLVPPPLPELVFNLALLVANALLDMVGINLLLLGRLSKKHICVNLTQESIKAI